MLTLRKRVPIYDLGRSVLLDGHTYWVQHEIS
jgi:hypothetical protein